MSPKRERFTNKRKRPFHNKTSKFQNRNNQQKRVYRHVNQLTEAEVGMTEFLSDLKGFSGVIKARYSDFQVNEINLEGVVAKLTDNSMPKDFLVKSEKFDYKKVETSPIEYIPQQTWEALKSLVSAENNEPVNLEVENLSKDVRKKIHECVKSHFGQKIVASTIVLDTKKYIQFKKFDKEEKSDTRFRWPEDKGEYVYFLVYKEALDTMDACLKISDCLKISPSNFTYAGVKDKRAKTTQWFCVRKVEPWKLLTKTKPLGHVKIGNFSFQDVPLKLGQLQGNKFRIALRNVTADEELINKSMSHVKEHGFINFYGLQRFGNDKEVPTFDIGINLLRGKWKEAVNLILKPKSSDDPSDDISKAKNIYFKSKGAEAALKVLEKSKNKCIEAKLLEGLKKGNDNDYVNALENVPRNMRLLYIHAFQSLIWNKMASKRLQLYGMNPVEGDFVLLNENDIKSDVNREQLDDEKDGDDEFKCTVEVKALSSDEITNYSIYDIVLPLPGYDIKYPENLQSYYKAAVEEHGLTLEMTKQKVKTYTLCGNYRKIIENVKELSWKTMRYNNPTDNLIRSDFEELNGDEEPKDLDNGKYKALVMEFILPPSSYATMVLREVLKTDTSSSAQAKLNDYHETKHEERKIIMDSDVSETQEKNQVSDTIPANSLLSNPEKYAEFKNSIFKTTGISVKRKSLTEETEEEQSKRNKKDDTEEEGGIKMEASLV